VKSVSSRIVLQSQYQILFSNTATRNPGNLSTPIAGAAVSKDTQRKKV